MRRALLAALAAASSACEGGGDVVPPSMETPELTPPEPTVNNAVFLREDFDNTIWIERKQGVLHDINQGQVTLPVRELRTSQSSGTAVFAGAADTDGLVEADLIVVDTGGRVEAADSVELRATREVVVSGDIEAGSGGVAILGGDRVVITGNIESRGPVSLQLVNPDGQILVAGRVRTRAGLDPTAPDAPGIEIVGRGSAEISGELVTEAAEGRTAGEIFVSMYGKVEIRSGRIASTAEPAGIAGAVHIRSEQAVELSSAGRIGPAFSALEPDERGGRISIESPFIRVGELSQVRAGQSKGVGSPVILNATETIEVGPSARIETGPGSTSGPLTIRTTTMLVGADSAVRVGPAQVAAGGLVIEAADRLVVGSGATIEGGRTFCGGGGQVTVTVAGVLLVEPGARLAGGDSAAADAVLPCSQPHPGGNLTIRARAAHDYETAVSPGTGSPDGVVLVDLSADVKVAAPTLPSDRLGFIRSRVIDRGGEDVGFRPMLSELVADIPEATRVEVSLAGSDQAAGPFTDWVDLNGPSGGLEPLRSRRFLRYRVLLYGRAFDTPAVDYLEIQLRPSL